MQMKSVSNSTGRRSNQSNEKRESAQIEVENANQDAILKMDNLCVDRARPINSH
jgi:hypothetical protein